MHKKLPPTELVRIFREDKRRVESLKRTPRETVADVVHLALEAYVLKAQPLPSEASA